MLRIFVFLYIQHGKQCIVLAMQKYKFASFLSDFAYAMAKRKSFHRLSHPKHTFMPGLAHLSSAARFSP